MNWLEEWAKVEVIGAWVSIGIIAIAVIVIAIKVVRAWSEDRKIKRRSDKHAKLVDRVFSKIKKGDVVYFKDHNNEIRKVTCEAVDVEGHKILVSWEKPLYDSEWLYGFSYGKKWALTKEELEEK